MKTRKVKTPNGWAVVVYCNSNPIAEVVVVFSNGYETRLEAHNSKDFDIACLLVQSGETEAQQKKQDID